MQRVYTIRMLEKRFSLILLSRQYRYFYVADKMPTDTVLPTSSKSIGVNTTTTKLHSTFLTAKQNHAIYIYRVINLLLTIYAVSAWNLPIIHLNNIYYIICFSIIRVRILSPLDFESTRFYFIIFHTYIRYVSVFYKTNQIRQCRLFVMIFQFSFLYTDRNSARACTFNYTVN